MEAGTGKFAILDYAVFISLMVASASIGLYFGCFAKRKQNNTNEYLMGSKSMSSFPVTMSMIASATSGVTLLGVPTEIYTYGTQYSLNAVTDIMVCTVTAFVFVPVYYKLQVPTTYQYLEMRYDKTIKYCLSIPYVVNSFIYMALVVYVPALALNQVTGVNIYLITTTSTAVCVFYTCLGGFRAVVWTDTLQACSMVLGTFVIVVIGVLQAGGLSEVWRIAGESDRLVLFNMDPSPFALHTFWSLMLGSFLGWLGGMASNQANLQRCLSLPTLRQAQRATIITSLGSAMFVIFSVFTGLAIYARYHDCDPFFSKAVKKTDQFLPYFVADVGAATPGIPGLFVAGIFSAALSSLSTTLNSVSCVLLRDIITPCLPRPMSDLHASWTLKGLVLILGVICTSMVYVIQYLGPLFQVSRSLGGILAGGQLGIFLFAVLVPWVKARSVLIGTILTGLCMTARKVGNQHAFATGQLIYPKKPVSVDSCPEFMENYFNNSGPYDVSAQIERNEQVFWMFRISYFYDPVINLILMIIFTAILSYFVGVNDPRDMNPDLFSPVIQPYLPKPREIEPELETLRQIQEDKKENDNIEENTAL